MSLFAPFVLLALVMIVASAAVGLAAHGPLGVLAAVVLVVAVLAGTRAGWRRVRRWWRSVGPPPP